MCVVEFLKLQITKLYNQHQASIFRNTILSPDWCSPFSSRRGRRTRCSRCLLPAWQGAMFQGSGNTRAAAAKRHRLLQQQRVAGFISRLESGRGSGSDHQGSRRRSWAIIYTRLCCQTCKRFFTILKMTVNYLLNCYCHSGTGWMQLLLLLAVTQNDYSICNSRFFV